MSFILDALKKSEIERQRQSIPGLMDAGPIARRRRFPLWAVALAVLLVVNLAVLLFVLLRSPAPTTVASAPVPQPAAMPASLAASAMPASAAPTAMPASAAPTATPASSAAGVTPTSPAPATAAPAAPTPARESDSATAPARADAHFSPMDAAPVYAPEVPAVDSQAEARGASAAGELRASSAGRAAPARAAQGDDPLLSTPADKSEEEALPTIGEVDFGGRAPLPELHLDVHVYATRPADRFVYINNRKYREGSPLADGLTLERIRRDGVVLNYSGLRFVLPRQQ